MASWATTRKLSYTVSVIVFFVVVGGWFYLVYYRTVSTCTDGKQNQGEEGVDCGGPCARACLVSVTNPINLWSRSFFVSHGFYNAVAYIENPNPRFGTRTATYRFKLYDKDNVLVADRIGKAFIAPNERFAIFEPRLSVGERIPQRTFFEFVEFSDWMKLDKEMPKILVRGEKFSNVDTLPRVDATLQNGTIVDVPDIDVVAIVYDKDDNALAASATKVDMLKADSSYNVTFTWPSPFPSVPSRVEIIPRVDLFNFIF